MITFTKIVSADTQAQHRVALSYHQRVKGRLRITTEDGLVAGIQIARGSVIEHQQKLADDEGQVLEVLAEKEPVSVATANTTLLFSQACYHLGNRHSEIQIEPDAIVYLSDHVLDGMLEQLGLSVQQDTRPFTPERGAYASSHSHAGHHSHDHHHSHSGHHSHDEPHAHDEHHHHHE